MKRSIILWQIIGFAVTSIGGTILHFLFDWLGKSYLIAPFSGINESTWEHMKLLFWPMFIFSIVQSFSFRDYDNYWCIKLRGILLGLTLIPVVFYTFNGVIVKSPDWINISIFFISALIAYIYETKMFYLDKLSCKSYKKAFSIFCFIALLFVLFTFRTPQIGIFKDPITGTYGI